MLPSVLCTLGQVLCGTGFVIEAVAMTSSASYPLRRRLPFQSPLVLQSVGCMIFYTGVLLIVLRRVLA